MVGPQTKLNSELHKTLSLPLSSQVHDGQENGYETERTQAGKIGV
jgi:hypothetical protein